MDKYLFSYGSNSTTQLENRIGRKFESMPAILFNHVRVFGGYSNHWKGAVASVVPFKNKVVHGSVVSLTQTELDKLDTFETDYYRVSYKVLVTYPIIKFITAQVYIKNNIDFVQRPSDEYLNAIKQMLLNVHHIDMYRLYNNQIVKFGWWSPTKQD